jgi:prepilin-type N-terminal cleavage/methylation domain-containing protein
MAAAEAKDHGFTLTELMVVVVIIGLLALVAIPALSRDSAKSAYETFANEVYQTLYRAKIEAISSKESRRVSFPNKTQYSLESYFEGTAAMLKQVTTRDGLEVFDYRGDRNGITGTRVAPAFQVYFSATSDVSMVGACGGSACATPCACTVTIYLKSPDDRYKGRIVIYQSTGYIRLYEGW